MESTFCSAWTCEVNVQIMDFPNFKKHQINVLGEKPTKYLTIILQVCRWFLSPQAIYPYKQAPLKWWIHQLACGGLDPETCLSFWPYTIITTEEG
jgi:hypothetical protein